MSAIEKTSALALRVQSYSNTSHIVTWLVDGGGRVTTLIKGACRPRSAFLGQYDLFCSTELLYYGRSPTGLHIAKECALLNARLRLRQDWRAYACASYVGELLLITSLAGGDQPALYRLAEATFDVLNQDGGRPELLLWFELQWLGLAGFTPELGRCTHCGAACGNAMAGLRWGQDGVVCPTCAGGAPRAPRRQSRPLPPDVLSILRRWQRQPDPHIMRTTQCNTRQVLVFVEILGTFIGYHIEETPLGRAIAFGMLGVNPVKKEAPL